MILVYLTTDYYSALTAFRSEILEHESGQWCEDDLSVAFLLYFLHLLSEEA